MKCAGATLHPRILTKQQSMSGGGNFVPVVTSSTVFHTLVELRPFIKSINVNIVVIKKGNPLPQPQTIVHPFSPLLVEEKFTKDGHVVHSFLVADPSASILLNLWDDIGAAVLNGDILQILGGFVTLYKGFIRLGCRVGKVIYKGKYVCPLLYHFIIVLVAFL